MAISFKPSSSITAAWRQRKAQSAARAAFYAIQDTYLAEMTMSDYLNRKCRKCNSEVTPSGYCLGDCAKA